MRKFLSLFLALTLLLCACNQNPDMSTSGESSEGMQTNTSGDALNLDFAKTDEEIFTERDKKTDYTETECIKIQLNGDSAEVSSDSVKISGSMVTITDEGCYIISGKLNDGMITIHAEETDKIWLILNGADVTSSTSAALYVYDADKVFVTLADGSSNVLSNGGSFEQTDENTIDAAIFSKQDLTFNGSGLLKVSSPVGHGIVSKDDLVFAGGSYTVTSASHGIDANDSIRITESSFDVTANKDGFHAENADDTSLGFIYVSSGSFKLSAEGDGISAGGFLQITNGNFDIIAGGGAVNGDKHFSDNWGGGFPPNGMGGRTSDATASDDVSTSMKGIKSAGSLLICNGTFKIDSADDSIHSNASLAINGGTFDIASGDDALHAEASLTITAGNINISESYEGLEALHITVSGGDISLAASDDGLNAAGGNDSSGTEGGRDGAFGGTEKPQGNAGRPEGGDVSRPEHGMGKPGGGDHGGGPGGMSVGNGSITISGGKLYIKALGDGIDANGTLTITGGHTTVSGPTRGDTATLDYDRTATVSGGTFIGTGATGMAQTFSTSEQGVITLNAGNQPEGTKITVLNSSGTELISYSPELDFAIVIFSSPEVVSGEKYSVTIGETTKEVSAS